MKVVKITTLWNHNYYFQIPNALLAEYRFEINNNCDKADYWFIWGGLKKKEKVFVDIHNVFFIIEEAYKERVYKQSFLNQFKNIITCREDIKHNNLIKFHDLGIWYFNKNFEALKNLEIKAKTKKISIVCSDLTWLPGHKKRFAFVNQLIGHFKDQIDVYGKGFNFIEDKFDALYPYEYSIAIENNSLKNYFTEKIFECYLTHTVPVYYGCTNIKDYFSENSFLNIDIADLKSSINTIEKIIEEKTIYKNFLPYLLIEKDKVLNEYHFFAAIDKIIKKHKVNSHNIKWFTVNVEFGKSYYSLVFNEIKKIIK